MSSILATPSRLRLPRTARTAVERARLSVVPVGRTRAPRMPFAVLVFLILGAGVVGLLMFNTHMQQLSFYSTKLENQANALVARQQSLDMALDRLRDPQRLARQGRRLGMVAPAVPAFIQLSDGRILGHPTPASPDDYVAVKPPAAPKPSSLQPAPIIVKVPATPKPKPATTTAGSTAGTTSGTTSTGAGSGTHTNAPAAGSNGTAPVQQGAPTD